MTLYGVPFEVLRAWHRSTHLTVHDPTCFAGDAGVVHAVCLSPCVRAGRSSRKTPTARGKDARQQKIPKSEPALSA
eukprot:2706939-Pleurochrysis_carterae.AAC.7